jgi:uncharacterized membrane-anchored protein
LEKSDKHPIRTAIDLDTVFFIAAFFVLIVGFSAYYVALAGTKGLIILRFTAGRGADILGAHVTALKMLGAGASIIAINACIGGMLRTRNASLARITSILTLGVCLLILAALSCIITAN